MLCLYYTICQKFKQGIKRAVDFKPTAQRVEKVFSIRCRLLRKVLNFVSLRRKMYINTSTEQKTKTPKVPQTQYLRHFSLNTIIKLIVFRYRQAGLACRFGRCFCIKMQRSPQETRNLYKRGIIRLIIFWRVSGALSTV